MARFQIPQAEWAELQKLSSQGKDSDYLTKFRAIGARMGFDVTGYKLIDARRGIIDATPVTPAK
jgi:hypothetical protein